MPSWMPPVLACAGVIGMIYGAFKTVLTTRFLQRARKTTGTIVDFVARSSGGTGNYNTIYYPVIEYEPWPDKPIRIQSEVGLSWKSHTIGQTVSVLYTLDNPNSARIDSPMQVWGEAIGALIIGAIFAGIGLFLWLA